VAALATVDMAVELPSSNAEPQQKPDKPIYLTLKPDLSLAVGETPIARDQLAGALDSGTFAWQFPYWPTHSRRQVTHVRAHLDADAGLVASAPGAAYPDSSSKAPIHSRCLRLLRGRVFCSLVEDER
jgi:hypothetical protein